MHLAPSSRAAGCALEYKQLFQPAALPVPGGFPQLRAVAQELVSAEQSSRWLSRGCRHPTTLLLGLLQHPRAPLPMRALQPGPRGGAASFGQFLVPRV